jgi:hypothetical protein
MADVYRHKLRGAVPRREDNRVRQHLIACWRHPVDHTGDKPAITLADLDGCDFATVGETSAIMRLDPRTVRRRIEDGKIPAIWLGEFRIPVRWLRETARAVAA